MKNYDAHKKLAEKMKNAREAVGLTQAEAAKLIGQPQSFISKIESGERLIDAVELLDLASIYKKPVQYFYKGL